jgi:hypothetical protein
VSNRRKLKLMKMITMMVNPDGYEADRFARRNDVSASCLIRRSMWKFSERPRENETLDVRSGKEVA